ncbi:hypothetical protein FRB96_003302 [Tulasnella sp. 330]|nr:hypothetical protein FRB96_003302 [Tulasnella sp. 330]KAG8873889.1 hypothetical protein FRB97_006354 [Tulasnella sp. 331]KAG8879314.1 hypothetical protein FRB98_005753 [Tulasnella sp. 332]
MQAPQISTLEAREDSTPPPAVSEIPVEPAGTATSADSNDVPPPVTTSTRPTRPQRQQDRGREVYVEEDEEDELIDDDDSGSPSKVIVRASEMTMAPQAPQQTIVPPPPPIGELQTPPPGSVVPRKRAYKRKEKTATTGSNLPTPPSMPSDAVPGPDDVDAPATAKRRRVRSAPKATLEVKRQEPDLQQDTASLMMWRMNEEQNKPDLDANLHSQGHAAPSTVAPVSSSPEKRKRGPRVGARDDPETSGNGSAHPQKRNRSAKTSAGGPSHQERVPVEEAYSQDYQTSRPSYADQTFAPYPQHQPDASYPSSIDLIHAIDLQRFTVPEDMSPEDLPSHVLAAAPRRPLPYTTNAVDPANNGLWSWYAGPLDKRRCRSWGKVTRTIRTIGGGTFLAKIWIGDAHSEIDHIRPPPPPLMLEHAPTASVISKASTPVPSKPSKPRKPRVRKNPNNGDVATVASSAAPTPPIVKPQNAMADAAHELEMLAGGT